METVKILIVDDDPICLKFIKTLLTNDYQCDVDIVESAEDALHCIYEMVMDWKPNCYDLILMDINLPILNGDVVTKIIKESETLMRHIPIIAITVDSTDAAEKDKFLKLGIDDVVAEVLPADKATAVKRFQDEGRAVAMAGDGINDAPALAQAQVGIAMGTGTDVAMESAGVTLVKGDLRGIISARLLSKATMRNIKQNLFWAFIYNALGVPVAAGVLYPVFGVLLSPMIAAAAMSFSSVSVISNALRLKRFKPPVLSA